MKMGMETARALAALNDQPTAQFDRLIRSGSAARQLGIGFYRPDCQQKYTEIWLLDDSGAEVGHLFAETYHPTALRIERNGLAVEVELYGDYAAVIANGRPCARVPAIDVDIPLHDHADPDVKRAVETAVAVLADERIHRVALELHFVSLLLEQYDWSALAEVTFSEHARFRARAA